MQEKACVVKALAAFCPEAAHLSRSKKLLAAFLAVYKSTIWEGATCRGPCEGVAKLTAIAIFIHQELPVLTALLSVCGVITLNVEWCSATPFVLK